MASHIRISTSSEKKPTLCRRARNNSLAADQPCRYSENLLTKATENRSHTKTLTLDRQKKKRFDTAEDGPANIWICNPQSFQALSRPLCRPTKALKRCSMLKMP